jgi:hypothetical protein
MPSVLSTNAVDKSTYIVTAAFTDEDDAAVAPTTLTWTLTDDLGTVINDREDVEVESPSSSEDIVLSGDDLAVADGSVRILTVEGTYNSDAGSGLPLKDQVRFTIEDLTAVT